MFPVFYWILYGDPGIKSTHRTLLSLSGIIGFLMVIMLYALDIPMDLLISFCVWRIVNLSLLLYSWNAERISVWVYLSEFVLGLLMLWKLITYFIPISSPAISFLTILAGSGSISAGILILIAFSKQDSSGKIGSSMRNLILTLIAILGIKLVWIIFALVSFTAEDFTGDIPLARYLWSYAPVPLLGGALMGSMIPVPGYGLMLAGKIRLKLKMVSAINVSLIMTGELFLKYMLIQYGFIF